MPALDRTLLKVLAGDEEIERHFSDAADLNAILRFEAALAEAEADAGLIGQPAAEATATAIAGFEPDWENLATGIARDGVLVPELVRQLRARIGPPHADAVHLGATSQDAIDTSLILRLAAIIPILDERLGALIKAFDALSEASDDTKLMGHTRMQQALPITVRDKIAAWSEPLARHRANIAAIRRKLLVIQLGGPVGTRESFNGTGDAVAKRLAALLDLGLAPAWHSERDPLVEFASLLSLLSGSLGKFGADVSLLAQNEIGAITLTGGGGSSAMPHKANPVNAELLVALARFNAGLIGTLHQALVHENERSGAAWTLEWLTLPQIVIAAGASLRIALALAGKITFQNKPV